MHSAPASALVIIPARMASTRLPGKPLAPIGDAPMIVHVWRRAVAAGIGEVIVACAEAEIAHAISAAGGRAVLTRPDHPSGSDRVFEALAHADPEGKAEIVVNVQGDLPTLDPALVRAALVPLANPEVAIATLIAPIGAPEERENENVVKVAVAPAPLDAGGLAVGRCLYFSRAAIPWGEGPTYHHIGLYAYRRAALARFVALPPSVLERRERLEQLRALEHGMRIDAALVETVPLGVDTPEDLERARALLASGRDAG
jgi:3-deoxy-manno-octulosonate cytidylyltransferase (CMP-KDO synthetase)